MIDKPADCSKCPVREIFFDSDWNIKQGIRHMSCRLNLDRATEIGKGIPAYCPLKPEPKEREEKDHYDMGWYDCVRVINSDYNLCKLG